MRATIFKISVFVLALTLFNTNEEPSQEFQGQASYFSKTKMNLGRWGARMSEAQKKQMEARMKPQLEKNYTRMEPEIIINCTVI